MEFINHHIIDIEKVNSIQIHCDSVLGSSRNSKGSNVIHTFSPKVSPGYKVIVEPNPEQICLPIAKTPEIECVRIWLTDQDNHPVDLVREELLQLNLFGLKNKQLLIKMIVKQKSKVYTSKRIVIHGQKFEDTQQALGSYVYQNKNFIAKSKPGAVGDIAAFGMTQASKALIRKMALETQVLNPASKEIIERLKTGSGLRKFQFEKNIY